MVDQWLVRKETKVLLMVKKNGTGVGFMVLCYLLMKKKKGWRG